MPCTSPRGLPRCCGCGYGGLNADKCCTPIPGAHEPKPWCPGCDKDFHDHPALLFRNLNEVHRAGRKGLLDAFPIGSLWHYGPIYENMETIVRVRPNGSSDKYSDGTRVYQRGKNYSAQPEDSEAKGKGAWFIACEVVSSPFHPVGYLTGLPPATMIPRMAVAIERGENHCCHGCGTWSCNPRGCQCAPVDWRDARIEALEIELDGANRRHRQAVEENRKNLRKLVAAKAALA